MWPGRALPGGFRVSARRPAGVADNMLCPPALSFRAMSTRGQATSSSIAVSRVRPDRVPVSRAPPPHAGHRRRWPGPCRSETRGTRSVPHRVPVGPVFACDGPESRAVGAARVCASLEGPRAARGRGGGGSRRESSCVTVGRRPECAVGGKPGGGRDRPAGCGRARGPSRRSRSPGEEGNRSRRAQDGAEDGVQRLAAVVAQQRSVGRR